MNTFIWRLKLLALNSSIISLDGFLKNFSGEFYLIKRPVLSLSLSGYLLLHGSQETLRIKETSQPEGWWPLLEDPVVELEVSI